MNTLLKIIVIFCIANVPAIVLGQEFNSIRFQKEVFKVKLALPANIDTTVTDDTITPDTLSKQASESLYINTRAAFAAMPLKRIKINQKFGPRIHPVTGKFDFHTGIDLHAKTEVVYSIMAGIVEKIGYNARIGYFVQINHGIITSIYGHLSYISVKTNERVEAGDGIAITGSSGTVTAEHLHFMLKYKGQIIDPWPYLKFMYKKELDSEVQSRQLQTNAIQRIKRDSIN